MATEAEKREQAISDYRKKLLKHREIDGKVRSLRESVKELKKEYDKTEDDLKALQSVGQIIGEVLRQLDEERCACVLPEGGGSRSTGRARRQQHFACARSHEDGAVSWLCVPLGLASCRPCLQSLSRRAAGPATWWRAAARSTRPSLRPTRAWRST